MFFIIKNNSYYVMNNIFASDFVIGVPSISLDVIFSRCSYDPGLFRISRVLMPAAIARGLPVCDGRDKGIRNSTKRSFETC